MNVYRFQTVVEFEDVDAYGIAHHSRLICFLERARVHFFRDMGIGVGDGSFQLVLVDLNLKFISPAKMMEQLTVELSVLELKAASLTWKYRLLAGPNHRLVLEGQIKMASINQQLKPVRFPDHVRPSLESILIP
jgi:acyl-CoA thioester hydrolase